MEKTIELAAEGLTKKIAEEIDRRLSANPHIKQVHADVQAHRIHVTFDEGMISAEDVRRLVLGCGCHCTHSSKTKQDMSCCRPMGKGMEKLAGEEQRLAVCAGTGMEHFQHEFKINERAEEGTQKKAGAEKAHEHAKEMGWWERFKMNMSMTMDMQHAGDKSMMKMMEDSIRARFLFSLLLTIPVILYSPLAINTLGLRLYSPIPVNWLLFLLTTPIVLYGGWIFIYGSYASIKKRTLNMSVLIATGVLVAYLFSAGLTFLGTGEDTFYEAAAMLVTFVLFGHWMEMRSRRGTSESLRALFDLVPPQARMIRSGKELLVPTAEIRVGDIIALHPGDKVAVDGEIVDGETSIDESLVTGESIPVAKKKGDNIIGGSINQGGSVKYKAVKIGEDTALAQIIRLVETAQNSKAPGQKLADRFAQYLVIVAIGAGAATFAAWYLVLGKPLLFALTFAVSTIVIACPDALGLATPTAVAVGTGLGAKHNILIKDAATLEQASKIQAIVFDKTGTLTEGKPRITDILPAKGYSQKEILYHLASAEAKTTHPLSKAVLEEAANKKTAPSKKVKKFESLAGHGIRATVDGKEVLIGTVKLMRENKIDISGMEKEVEKLLGQGKTLMLLSINGKIAGAAAAQDKPRATAGKTIERLKELGIEAAMITGDNKKTAEAVAKELGIDRVFAEVLPEEKAQYVKKLQQEGKFVAMVGDGINDAPALAQADIGIAIGAGTDVAIETASIVLMRSDPADALRAIRLSKETVKKMKQNLFWASIYNLLAIPIAAGILYPSFGIALRPEWSALLMSASSIIVATNAVMLNRAEKKLIEV